MDIDAKLRPLFLLQILKERTDEDNYLTTTQLCDILKREYGLDTHRTTLKSDIEVLQRAGYSIILIRWEMCCFECKRCEMPYLRHSQQESRFR